MSESAMFALFIIGSIIALVWLIFPFIVWSELGQMNKQLRKISDRMDTVSRAGIETSQHTRQLRDFFDGRNVELRQD